MGNFHSPLSVKNRTSIINTNSSHYYLPFFPIRNEFFSMWNFSHLNYWYLWLWEEFLWGSLWRNNDNCKTNRSWVSGNSAQLGWKLIQIITLHNQREEFPIFRQRHFSIKTLPSLVSDKKLCPHLSARNMAVYLPLL